MRIRKIIRLKGYDYSQAGYYFVTIEPFDCKYFFSKISNEKIILNDIGKIIDNQWKWIFSRFDYIQIDEYVIMPDHFHGIIRILPDSKSNVRATLESPSMPRAGQDPPVHLHKNFNNRLNLSHIIGAFKTTSSKLIHESGYIDFKWKRSFHDRIIRDDELNIKRNYIKNNPKNINGKRVKYEKAFERYRKESK